jgi:alpha-N-acetylgalactosaminidase
MAMADRMVADGYRDAGYVQVNIDDCWSSTERDPDTQELVSDPDRFPSGIPYLANYMHTRGLRLGIYGDVGNYTCGGYPGQLMHLQLDAQTFANWNVDMFKFDGCNLSFDMFGTVYPEMSTYLNQTGRPIIYSCEWPVYTTYNSTSPNITEVAQWCNLWRITGDIDNSWSSLSSILTFYVQYQDRFLAAAGPGRWNDPDMLIVGDTGLTVGQAQTQMALWSIMAAPLLMSVDLRTITSEFSEILLNRDVIAVDQDPLGIPGGQIIADGDLEVWSRPVTPNRGATHSHAIAYFNHGNNNQTIDFAFQLQDLGLIDPEGFTVKNLFTGEQLGTMYSTDWLNATVASTETFFVKAELISIGE